MKTAFYNRTAYSYLGIAVPHCFLDLDKTFERRLSSWTAPELKLAENICRRMADIDFDAKLVADALQGPNLFVAANMAGSLMVGYLNACKSLLDAISITLADVYKLGLKSKQKDFTKNDFWKTLRAVKLDREQVFQAFRGLVDEVVRWRDSAVHRITPLIIVHSPGEPEKIPNHLQSIQMASKPDIDIAELVRNNRGVIWINPTDLHSSWKPRFLELCNEICADLDHSVRDRDAS
jgi:hypothetical protein